MADPQKPADPLDMTAVLASTVHDVKNSLGLISAQIEEVTATLRDTDPGSADKLNRILLESNRINSGLSHMLGVYRIDNQLLHPSLEETLVMDVLEEAATRYAGNLEQQKITLDIDCEDEELTWVMDASLADHVLTNILTNAIRYTKDWIGLSARVENDQLCIAIDDNGSGYPDALLNCLEPDASLRVRTSSTGLGIYFADGIARLHHNSDTGETGRIELVNKEGGGARFALWLP
ncbi:MAG: HAMP domain-containing histidine kinase [Natronospirillum sp.]|uniref:sensor histidine kinase n=1 Tax=Natronospirillum sp. TaxID=2812955 RepID=UPI0025D75E88|nr:HAMP domain-containing sensor histidine kinase [Natronospirillum sp.]MCH8550901.1 HAMP domain-containing histidine kinase [Natronospirillum sp.]